MAGQGSARVSLREIDLSQVRNPQQTPQGVPAAVVGPARKGPAFVPHTFANMQQFNEVFGSMLEQDRESNSNLYGPLALNEWMKSAQAGSYIRVLGVGDGTAAKSSGKTDDAGFIVGEELVQEQASGLGKVGKNKSAEITDNKRTEAKAIGRTHFLGCFMKDKEDSRFLCDSGVQKETSSAVLDDIEFANAAFNNNNTLQLFLPKEVVNDVVTVKVFEDVIIIIELITALAADVAQIADNTIQILSDDNDAATLNNNFQEAFSTGVNAGVAKDNDSDFKFNNLSVKLTEIFSAVADGTAGDKSTKLTLASTRKEGNEVYLVQTVGNTAHISLGAGDVTALNEKAYFTGAHLAAPVIQGVLMTPQGVRPLLNPNTNLTQFFNEDEATANPRKESHSIDFGNTAAHLVGYTIGDVDSTTQSFKLILNGYKDIENPAVLDCSFDPDSDSYFAKVLNTDPTKIEELGHYLHAYWSVDKEVAIPANDGLTKGDALLSLNQGNASNCQNMIGFLVAGEGASGRNTSEAGKPNYEDFSSKYRASKTPWIVSQFTSVGDDTSPRPATASLGGAKKLFKLHALDDGEISNSQYRLLISNLGYNGENDYGSFDLALEKIDSDPINGETLISWNNANLNPDSRNFIGRLIGDMYTYYDFDGGQRLKQKGKYEVKNKFVRIELSPELDQGILEPGLLPAGFQGHSHLFTSSTGNFLEGSSNVAAGNKIFTNSNNQVAAPVLDKSEVLPLDLVKSINRKEDKLSADDDLAWGVKFALRENKETSDTGHKELSEKTFNDSIYSWTKFFPTFGDNPAWIETDDADSNQNSFFTLEKVLIPTANLTSDEITSWDGALYKRNPSFDPHSSDRFVRISKDATGKNSKYLKFRCLFQGGFDGVNIFDKEKASLSGTASMREGNDETASQKFSGPTISAYKGAVDVLKDKSSVEFQLLSIPGQRVNQITDYALEACEDRFDALFIMDIEQKGSDNKFIEDLYGKPSVSKTIKRFEDRTVDSSFGAAYFPDVLMRRPSDNAPVLVPPTVGMMGVMSRNDSIADPWFAPAGLTRGRLNAFDSQVQMNRDVLDDLYDMDINPIYVPAGRSNEVYAFGQKTLLQDASALDRINVRRLLIDVRRKVKKVGEQLLFEPNRASTLSKFSSLVEPIMANVQQRRGVERYKVQIDTTTTTQNDIENNTIRGKIYLQPTKSIEFISLDFVVANNIQ
jgi:hypothetical protein